MVKMASSMVLTLCWIWFSIIARLSMIGSKRHWLGIPTIRTSLSCEMSQRTGCPSLAVVLWAPFGDTGKICTSLMWPKLILTGAIPMFVKSSFKVVNFWRDKGVKGFPLWCHKCHWKDEVLTDCPEQEGKLAYTDKPLDYLGMMNEATFGQDASVMTVGEMSATTIWNCILYTAPDRELSMAFNFHHLKVDWGWTEVDP